MLSASTICYEIAEKTKAIAHGGIGAMHRLVQRTGLATRINTDVQVLGLSGFPNKTRGSSGVCRG